MIERGARSVVQPLYSPDHNPIAMAFVTLKAHFRGIGARTIKNLSNTVGSVCNLCSPEGRNHLKAAG